MADTNDIRSSVEKAASQAGESIQQGASTALSKAQELASSASKKVGEAATALGERVQSAGGTLRERGPHDGMPGTATGDDPAGTDRGSSTVCAGAGSTWRCIAPGWPYETACTGWVKVTSRGWAERRVKSGVFRIAVGAVMSRWASSVEPASQEMRPGRLTTTSIDSRCPAGIRPLGQI